MRAWLALWAWLVLSVVAGLALEGCSSVTPYTGPGRSHVVIYERLRVASGVDRSYLVEDRFALVRNPQPHKVTGTLDCTDQRHTDVEVPARSQLAVYLTPGGDQVCHWREHRWRVD